MSTKQQAREAASALQQSLRGNPRTFTVADAASASGLSLQRAELGLHHLLDEYRGHLSVTQKGELLFSYPHGFTKPWERVDRLTRAWRGIKSAVVGVGKFIVRAWVSVVLVGYVVLFAVVLLALSAANRQSDRDHGGSLGSSLLLHTLLRVVLDSLFWTFHPFSPFRVEFDRGAVRQRKQPFYEKVNRFFFGPERQAVDPRQTTRTLLSEIRARQGRIGVVDAMRVTGLGKEKLDPILARLLLDYEGGVEVSDEGAVVYRFPHVRPSAQDIFEPPPVAIWHKLEAAAPLTGNSVGTNLLIGGLNGFNLVMSVLAIQNGWTLERIQHILTVAQSGVPPELVTLPPAGTPLLLGWVPLVFSLALFALPLGRTLGHARERRRVQAMNGRRGLLRAVVTQPHEKGLTEDVLCQAWRQAAGVLPGDRELTRAVVALGGELHVEEDGSAFYHFPQLQAELRALQRERRQAGEQEVDVGAVVFSSAR
ncbi:MAG: hypothetical protein AAF471_02465 [Myxococcota bacterium]